MTCSRLVRVLLTALVVVSGNGVMHAEAASSVHWPRLVLRGPYYSMGTPPPGRREQSSPETPSRAVEASGAGTAGLPALPTGWRFVGRPVIPGPQTDPKSLAGDKAVSHPGSGNTTPDHASQPVAPLMPNAQADSPAKSASLWIPLASDVSLGAFQTAERTTIVIDGRHAFDLAALRGLPLFADLDVAATDDTTTLTFSVPSGQCVDLVSRPGGWILKVRRQGAGRGPPDDAEAAVDIDPVSRGTTILLPTPHAARVVTMADTRSGRRLLVGLVTGETRIGVGRRGIGFALRPSLVGVVLASDADQIAMRRVRDGFIITAPDDPDFPLRVAGRTAPVATTGLFPGNIASLDDVPALREAARRAAAHAAFSPPGQRFNARIDAARAALALADTATARAIMQVALRDDPQGANRPDVALIRLVLQALDPRAGEDTITDDDETSPAFGPEATFWRGLIASRHASAGDGARQGVPASMIADGLPQSMHYPAPLRRQALQAAAEVLARAGHPLAPGVTDTILPPSETAFLQALSSLHAPHPDDQALARLAHDADPVIAAKAQELDIDRRRALGTLSADQAADRYDLLRPGARLASRELAVSEKELMALKAAGRWQAAADLLATLETSHLLSRENALKQRRQLMTAMIADPALMSGDARQSLGLISLLLPHLDLLVPETARTEGAMRIARRLAALGLRDKALSVLDSISADRSAEPEITLLQAALLLDSGHKEDARKALATLSGAVLAKPLGTERALLYARLALLDGDPRKAISSLAGVDTSDGWKILADASEQVQDWPGATRALDHVLSGALAGNGALTGAQQAAVVRLGADALRSGDHETIDRLKAQATGRITDPAMQPMFALLTRPESNATALPAAQR